MSESPTPPVALRLHRERAIERLCEHFARDHLEAHELEALIDRAHRAATLAELEALTADLPELSQPSATGLAPVGPEPGRTQEWIAAVMGGTDRRGSWRPARQINVFAFWGGVRLDFRDVALPAGLTEINVLAIMGGVEILVPPGVHVESNGVGIMGGFTSSGRGKFPVDARMPVLRVSGLALMGGVEVRTRPRHVEAGDDPDQRRRLPGA